MNTPNETPEWDYFKRLEEVEQVTSELREKAEATEPTLENIRDTLWDTRLLAFFNFMEHFMNSAIARPHRARALKDSWIEQFKKFGMDKNTLDILANAMIIICEQVEDKE